MQIIFRKSLAKKQQVVVVLVALLPILIVSSIGVSDSSISSEFILSGEPLTSESTNYTIGVLPNEEYTWIITDVREKNLEIVIGSNWTASFEIININCKIATIPKTISNLKNLKKLDLCLNRIKAIPAEIVNCQNLTDLDISRNLWQIRKNL